MGGRQRRTCQHCPIYINSGWCNFYSVRFASQSPESFPGFGQIGREFCSDPVILFRRVSAAVVPVYVLLYAGAAVFAFPCNADNADL